MTRKQRERLTSAYEVIRGGARVGVVGAISVLGAKQQAAKFYGAYDEVKRIIIR